MVRRGERESALLLLDILGLGHCIRVCCVDGHISVPDNMCIIRILASMAKVYDKLESSRHPDECMNGVTA